MLGEDAERVQASIALDRCVCVVSLERQYTRRLERENLFMKRILALLTGAALAVSIAPAPSGALTNLGYLPHGTWSGVTFINITVSTAPLKICSFKVWSKHGNFNGTAYSETRVSRIANVSGACATINAQTVAVSQAFNGNFAAGPLSTVGYNAPVVGANTVPGATGAFSSLPASIFFSDHQAIQNQVSSDVYRYNGI
jgi:hypothetical protein